MFAVRGSLPRDVAVGRAHLDAIEALLTDAYWEGEGRQASVQLPLCCYLTEEEQKLRVDELAMMFGVGPEDVFGDLMDMEMPPGPTYG